jgi:hypothetical protein
MSVLPNETVANQNRLRQAAVFRVVSADGFEAAIRIGVSAFSDAALRHRQRQAAVRIITVAHATANHPATAVEGGPNYQLEA